MSLSVFFYQFSLRDSSCAVGLGIPIDHASGINGVVSSVSQTEHSGWIDGNADHPVNWRIASEFEQHGAHVALEVKARQWAAVAQIVEVSNWSPEIREPCFLLARDGMECHRLVTQVSLAPSSLLETVGFQACYASTQILSLMFPDIPPLFQMDDISRLHEVKLDKGDVLPFVLAGDNSVCGVLLLRETAGEGLFLAEMVMLGGGAGLKDGECVNSRFISSAGETLLHVEAKLGEIVRKV